MEGVLCWAREHQKYWQKQRYEKSFHLEVLSLLLFLETTIPCEKAHAKQEDDEIVRGKRLDFPAEALPNQPCPSHISASPARVQPYYQVTENFSS